MYKLLAFLNFVLCISISVCMIIEANPERKYSKYPPIHEIGPNGHLVQVTPMNSAELTAPPQMNQLIPMIPMNQMNQMSPTSSLGAMGANQRAASFMVDPLIIIALIALPTIGMLGVSSLVMPLIPIGIYLIQQFLPSAGRRRRRDVKFSMKELDNKIEILFDNFYKMLDKFNA